MKTQKIAAIKHLKNERGILTLDFLFAFVMVLGFAVLFFSLSLTLTVAEVTQYITFSAARNSYAGHFSPETQIQIGHKKFEELVKHSVFNPFYKNGWFEIQQPPFIGRMSEVIPEYNSDNPYVNRFFGVGVEFTARMLDFQIPFYGSTAPSGDGSGSGFKTIIGSYLGREPNTSECTNFTGNRWQAIRQLAVTGGAPYTTSTSDNGYMVYVDNGC